MPNYYGILSGGIISVGNTVSATQVSYPDEGAGANNANYSVNYELGRPPTTLNSSFTVLINASNNMRSFTGGSVPSLVAAKAAGGFPMSTWYGKRGVSMGLNFSTSYSNTSYSKYGVDLCTGTGSATASVNPYRNTATGTLQNLTISCNGSVASSSSGSVSVSYTGGCGLPGGRDSWSILDSYVGKTVSGNGAISWNYQQSTVSGPGTVWSVGA